MRIISYEYRDVDETRWRFTKVNFQKINLLVGNTSTGKTFLLNTLFNLGHFAVSKDYQQGCWDIGFEQKGSIYRWLLETEGRDAQNEVVRDFLWEIQGEKEIPIVERERNTFKFEGREMPKLAKDQSSVSLLENEDRIQPIFEGFASIMRRRFSLDAHPSATSLQSIPSRTQKEIERTRDIKKIFSGEMGLSANLYLLSEYFPVVFSSICDYFGIVFPFVKQTALLDLSEINKNVAVPGRVPVFCIKERRVDHWIPIDQLSSGMQKVLLILTDIHIMPEGGIYLIDEYENSLGVNAIEFLPTYLLELTKDVQFFLTSHHPYIINQIPIANWYIFHRDGSDVSIKFGQDVIDRYGKSKQKAFVQLINDPFFVEGVQ